MSPLAINISPLCGFNPTPLDPGAYAPGFMLSRASRALLPSDEVDESSMLLPLKRLTLLLHPVTRLKRGVNERNARDKSSEQSITLNMVLSGAFAWPSLTHQIAT